MLSQDKIRKLSLCALFSALALIFSYIETLFPIPVPIPGVKIGIANLVVLIAIYRFNFKTAFFINIFRIIVSSLLFSGVFAMIYSLAGGILSILFMYVLYITKKFSMVGVSLIGGVMHNLGQLITASFIMETPSLFSYFPVLLFSGIVSGIVIGIVAYLVERKLPNEIKL